MNVRTSLGIRTSLVGCGGPIGGDEPVIQYRSMFQLEIVLKTD